MNHFDDPTGSPPPPAYSEQEFDQKISTAAQQSLTTHRAQLQHEENAWEVWDESVFEAAASELDKLSLRDHRGPQPLGESSSRSPKNEASGRTLPLRIHKKNPSGGTSSTPAGKQKPSWLEEAEGSAASTSVAATLAAPPYTPSPSSASASSTELPNPYSAQDWAATSPSRALPDPYSEQANPPNLVLPDPYPGRPWSAQDLAGTAPPQPRSPNTQLAPPPLNEGRLSNPLDNARRISAPAISGTDPSPSTSRPISLPIQINTRTTNLNVDAPYQQRPITLQSSAPLYSIPNNSRRSLRSSPETRPTNYEVPSQLTPRSAVNAYRPSALPQNTAIPQLKFDLSAAYGKGPATRASGAQPQVYNAAAFYNSAVSAHLIIPGQTEQRRPSYQVPPSPSASTFQSNQSRTTNGPNWFSQLPPGAGIPYNPHVAAPHNAGIMSPAPSYPAGSNSTMPQILAAATEAQYAYYPAASHSTSRGQTGWTDYSPYR